jgi:hypothetical protein
MDLVALFTVAYAAALTVAGLLMIGAGIFEALSADRNWLTVFGWFLVGVIITIACADAFVRAWSGL